MSVNSSPEEREAKTRSSAIDRQLRHDARHYENTIKILLLGKGSVAVCVHRRDRWIIKSRECVRLPACVCLLRYNDFV